jgi:hypothetical protein
MTTRFSSHLFDELIAPGASKFNQAEIPDMQDHHKEQKFWVNNFFLNSAVTIRYKSPLSAYATAYLRRAENAFVMHKLARDATLSLLSLPQMNPSHYARALLHWEGFLTQAAQGHNVLIRTIRDLISNEAFRAYRPGDGSIEQRLHSVYNALKHAEKRINNGQILPDSVSPVWMTNEGLRSTDTNLDWHETGEILDEMARWASGFQNPAGFADWLRRQPTDDRE